MGVSDRFSSELVPGTLGMLALKALSNGELHGYGVAEIIERYSDHVLRIEEGALYPALHRLEVRGLLSSRWGVSENNRRAKFYKVTAAGRKVLAQESAQWSRVAAAIERVMQMA
jgi:transcriptional regulator